MFGLWGHRFAKFIVPLPPIDYQNFCKMKRNFLLLFALLMGATSLYAQEYKRVENVTLHTLGGEPATLPMWGEKNLLIFYVDPDHPNQNADFAAEMEEEHLASGDNIYGFGILNLKDAPLIPNGLACNIANKRTAKNGATILVDKGRVLSTSWELGSCNNYFVILLVSKQGELIYYHKGEFTPEEKAEFYRTIDPYR